MVHAKNQLPCKDVLPLLPRDEGRGIHGAAVTDHKDVPILSGHGEVKKCVLNLDHGLQKVFLHEKMLFRKAHD